jgi:hypothetical protein
MRRRFRPGVRAAGMAGLGAGSERVIKDGLDGARAPAAFGAAAEASVNLLGISRKVFRGIDGVADIVVAEEVTGTNNHENEKAPSVCGAVDNHEGCGTQKKKPYFQAIPN